VHTIVITETKGNFHKVRPKGIFHVMQNSNRNNPRVSSPTNITRSIGKIRKEFL
jgi:hypothetical protein